MIMTCRRIFPSIPATKVFFCIPVPSILLQTLLFLAAILIGERRMRYWAHLLSALQSRAEPRAGTVSKWGPINCGEFVT